MLLPECRKNLICSEKQSEFGFSIISILAAVTAKFEQYNKYISHRKRKISLKHLYRSSHVVSNNILMSHQFSQKFISILWSHQ